MTYLKKENEIYRALEREKNLFTCRDKKEAAQFQVWQKL